MKRTFFVAAVILAATALASGASAQCVTKGAKATSGSESSAKWFVMETMVQDVSWGLWPGWLSTGKVEGYKVSGERYKCQPASGGVFCEGRATFCKAK